VRTSATHSERARVVHKRKAKGGASALRDVDTGDARRKKRAGLERVDTADGRNRSWAAASRRPGLRVTIPAQRPKPSLVGVCPRRPPLSRAGGGCVGTGAAECFTHLVPAVCSSNTGRSVVRRAGPRDAPSTHHPKSAVASFCWPAGTLGRKIFSAAKSSGRGLSPRRQCRGPPSFATSWCPGAAGARPRHRSQRRWGCAPPTELVPPHLRRLPIGW